VYNPEIGFALTPNVAGHPKYPFDPFYHGFSPRVAVAWNPDLGPALGGKNTVFRAATGESTPREWRDPGVDAAVEPWPPPASTVQDCGRQQSFGNGKWRQLFYAWGGLNVSNAFRIGGTGVGDGTTAPLATNAPSTTLPQPSYPGIGGRLRAPPPHPRPAFPAEFG